MAKKQLTEDEYIAELNRRLRDHPHYEEGMAFEPSPPGSTGKRMSGYSTKGPWSKTIIYADVAHKVATDCELKIY